MKIYIVLKNEWKNDNMSTEKRTSVDSCYSDKTEAYDRAVQIDEHPSTWAEVIERVVD